MNPLLSCLDLAHSSLRVAALHTLQTEETLRAEEASILAELAALDGGGDAANGRGGRRSLLSRARRSNGGGGALDAGLMAAVASLGDETELGAAAGDGEVSAEDAAAMAMATAVAPPRSFGISSGQLLVGGSHHQDVNPLAQSDSL